MAGTRTATPAAFRARRLSREFVNERVLTLALLAIITGLALVLRWIAAHESLSGDELFTYDEVTPSSLGAVFDRIDLWENSPPVFLILAWLSGKVGDPTTWIRLPSVLAGAATVPVVYLLGDAIAGRRTGMIAAALFAVLPFAVFYGSEGRPYALLVLFAAASTLALLRALDAPRGRSQLIRWGAYAVAAALALYTHYIAGIVIALQGGWALLSQPARRRQILLANAVVALLFLPRVPVLDDNTAALLAIEALHPLTLENVSIDPLRLAVGHPYIPFDQVPGLISLALTGAATAIIAIGWWRPGVIGSDPIARRSLRAKGTVSLVSLGWLLVSLTGGILLVTLLYSAVADNSIWEPRTLITAVPYACVLVGIAASTVQGRPGLVAAAALVLAALLGSVRMLISYPRPNIRAAAEAIESRAAPGTPVVENALGAPPQQQDLAIYLDARFPLIRPAPSAVWPRGTEVYTVVSAFQIAPWYAKELARVLDRMAADAGAPLVETLKFQGFPEVTVKRYGPIGPAENQAAAAAFHAYLEQHPAERGASRRSSAAGSSRIPRS